LILLACKRQFQVSSFRFRVSGFGFQVEIGPRPWQAPPGKCQRKVQLTQWSVYRSNRHSGSLLAGIHGKGLDAGMTSDEMNILSCEAEICNGIAGAWLPSVFIQQGRATL
jgi:hypothetical protein